MSEAEIERAILAHCGARGAGKTVCPSEVARALATSEAEWRALMPSIREAARRLLLRGQIRVSQRGREVDPLSAKGAIRLALAGTSPGAGSARSNSAPRPRRAPTSGAT